MSFATPKYAGLRETSNTPYYYGSSTNGRAYLVGDVPPTNFQPAPVRPAPVPAPAPTPLCVPPATQFQPEGIEVSPGGYREKTNFELAVEYSKRTYSAVVEIGTVTYKVVTGVAAVVAKAEREHQIVKNVTETSAKVAKFSLETAKVVHGHAQRLDAEHNISGKAYGHAMTAHYQMQSKLIEHGGAHGARVVQAQKKIGEKCAMLPCCKPKVDSGTPYEVVVPSGTGSSGNLADQLSYVAQPDPVAKDEDTLVSTPGYAQ